jgi:hypothetical protein
MEISPEGKGSSAKAFFEGSIGDHDGSTCLYAVYKM